MWLRWLRICLQCEIYGFDPWVGKILWRKKCQQTPVFLPGEFHGPRSLAGYSLWDCRVAHKWSNFQIRSDQISRSVMSNSFRPHESQHTRPPCPSPTPRFHWDSRPSSQWCHPAISSSVVPFSSCPQNLPASESFPMSQLFAWGGQSTAVSALASSFQRNPRADLLKNGLVGSPCRLSRVFSNTTVQKHQFFGTQPSSQSNSHIHTWPQEKP